MNCCSHLGTSGRLGIAKRMEEFCEKELYDIEVCGECYHRSNTKQEWFTEVCDPPHLLVWARTPGFPYWPAKVIAATGAQNKIDVRFFGQHEMCNAYADDCLVYSKTIPNERLSNRKQRELKSSQKVCISLDEHKSGRKLFQPNLRGRAIA